LNFPASDEETRLVHQSMRELKDALEKAAILSEKLVDTLEDNFLAVTSDYRKELFPAQTRICSSIWKLSILFFRTLTQKQRIIPSETNKS
jgi:uncharacterized membrane protein (DUF106 family)